MQKVSSTDAAALLKQAGAAIRHLAEENKDLREKIAQQVHDERVTKIARDMEEKGLSPDLSFEEKVASIRDVPNLDVTEEAVKLATPQSNNFGVLSEIPGNNPTSALEHFIFTGEDPSGL